jgi:hypothetical protein
MPAVREHRLHADCRIVGGLVARSPRRIRLARVPDARASPADSVVLDLVAPGVPITDDDNSVLAGDDPRHRRAQQVVEPKDTYRIQSAVAFSRTMRTVRTLA